MNELNYDRLLKGQNKFILTNAVAARARQVSEGSLPYIDNFDPSNSIITALRELTADKIRVKVLSAPAAKPKEEIVVEEFRPSAVERLSRGKKAVAPKKKKEKK